jgi:hypothetical protein
VDMEKQDGEALQFYLTILEVDKNMLGSILHTLSVYRFKELGKFSAIHWLWFCIDRASQIICLGRLQTVIFLISASWVTRITPVPGLDHVVEYFLSTRICKTPRI